MLRRREHISDLILRSRASLRGVSKDEVAGLENTGTLAPHRDQASGTVRRFRDPVRRDMAKQCRSRASPDR
jgi:hypothetical protein